MHPYIFVLFIQVLQEAFDRCMNVLNQSSKHEDTAVQVSLELENKKKEKGNLVLIQLDA